MGDAPHATSRLSFFEDGNALAGLVDVRKALEGADTCMTAGSPVVIAETSFFLDGCGFKA